MKIMKPNSSENPQFLDLPSHILSDILCNLPIKSILSYKLVCKFMCSIIKNPHFKLAPDRIILLVINNYEQLYLVEPEIDAVMRRKKHGDLSLCLSKKSVTGFNNVEFDGIPVKMLGFVNSCNGLVCLTPRAGNWGSFFVCNPVTSDYVVVKQTIPSMEIGPFCLEEHCDFGFSAKSNQYKVLRFYSYKRRHFDDGPMFAEIYTLGCDHEGWRGIDPPPPQNYRWVKKGTFLEGSLHWILLEKDGLGVTIAAFDFHEERFSFVSPPCVVSNSHFERLPLMSLSVLDSRLCLCLWAYDGHCDVWVMNDYGVKESWSKLFVVSGPDLLPFKPLAYLKSGRILMLTVANQLVSYHVAENRWKKIKILGAVHMVEAVLFNPLFSPTKELVTRLHGEQS